MSHTLCSHQLDQYLRAANYLSASQIYLYENCLLREPLAPRHIKPRLLGHWGTCPGLNLIYTHLNRMISQRDQPVLLVVGPGHGAPAILANLFLEGSLAEHYPEYSRNVEGATKLIRAFSWPGGFPSHLTPATPGTIHEGGELGYALATAFGAAFDNPELMVACVVGDGEAETGPTATAWHCAKYLNPARDGAVLPIVHLNHYKIASRTIFGAMSDEELSQLFSGLGYKPIFVQVESEAKDSISIHNRMSEAMDTAATRIAKIQQDWRYSKHREKPVWPLILLRSPKGWTVTRELDGEAIEGTHRAHQVPIPDPKNQPGHLTALERWLRSYRPDELFANCDSFDAPWLQWLPKGERRMGLIPQSNGGSVRVDLDLPEWKHFAISIDRCKRGSRTENDTKVCGELLRNVIKNNPDRYRIFCPDEMDSNKLTAVFDATNRQFVWPHPPADPNIASSGNVLEILSEHTCQAWLQGYLLTGRHGLFPCYEAFVSIIDSMMGQYAKFLKRAEEISWRRPVSSFNYLLSSEGWRQDHNGYSHQMPGFLNMLLNKKGKNVRIYLPPDANCLLSTVDHCLRSTGKINLIIASKQSMPQWLSAEEASNHCRSGISVWPWASNVTDEEPDIVMACAGVYPTAEAVMAAWTLLDVLPELRLRFVNVTDLLILEQESFHPHGLSDQHFESYFGQKQPVVFNFHGYPSAVQKLLWNRPDRRRFLINGYVEEGTTTTPFSLLAANGIDRYYLIDQVLGLATDERSDLRSKCEGLRAEFQQRRENMLEYAISHGEDHPSFAAWNHPGQTSDFQRTES